MYVEIYSRDSLETVVLEGRLQELLDALNEANGYGYAFVTFRDVNGDNVLINLLNITKARERDEVAFLSW